jgi:hypothetical protein
MDLFAALQSGGGMQSGGPSSARSSSGNIYNADSGGALVDIINAANGGGQSSFGPLSMGGSNSGLWLLAALGVAGLVMVKLLAR